MTDKQPEALRLADGLEQGFQTGSISAQLDQAAAELRRLHEVNAELLKVLNDLADWESGEVSGYMDAPWVAQKARVAIAKATGEQQ
jgi:hypothetical protein